MARAPQSDCDVLIAGGGMIGSSLALALQPLGLRLTVVEAIARERSEQPSFDDRSTALSRSSQRTFEALGLWPEVCAAATPIERIHVSDRGRFGFAHIDAAEQKVEALGYVVINRVLGNVLQTALQQAAVDVRCPERIVAVAQHDEFVRVETDSGDAVTARLLVAADGAASSVREMLGIAAMKHSYGQNAVVGNLLTERPIGRLAYERFTAEGPLALLPISDGRAAFVRTVAARDVERVMALDDAAFLDELQTLFGYRLGRLHDLGKRSAYPLALSRATRVTAQRGVLVGNAAHGLHPVAAQGFNLGLRDVAALADCIADAAGDVGADSVLSRYGDWRRADQKKLVHFTNSLVGLFQSTRPPLRALRNLGMLAFDFVPGVRAEFARHTMGLAGRLPRLSRGVPLS